MTWTSLCGRMLGLVLHNSTIKVLHLVWQESKVQINPRLAHLSATHDILPIKRNLPTEKGG